MKKSLLVLLTFISFTATAQLSGYFTQDFEATTFPPTGWTVQNIAGPTYTWVRSIAQAHTSTASTFIRYDAIAGGGQDWLITPQYSAVTGDSVVFWMRLAFAGYQPDSLAVKVSTTTNAVGSFNSTILLLREGVNYPGNATTWYRYAVSLNAFAGQNIYVAFKHYNVDGDGLYLDDIAIGTKPPHDISANSITTPSSAGMGTLIPSATFKNTGTNTESFNVTAEINPGGYTSTVAVPSLAPDAIATVNTFAGWTPAAPGTYTVKVYSQLGTDMAHTNDTLTKSIIIYPAIQEYGWESATPIPASRWAHATAFTKECVSGTDTSYLYAISGADGAFANTALVSRLNLETNVWTNVAPIPQSRTQISAAVVEGKIYVPGGYGASFSPVNTMSIYDPLTNIWSTGAAMPQATGDYAIGTYGDSLIYVVGGYSGSGDLNNVQIYNTHTNTWTAGTLKTGAATAGGRMGISGNTIVYAGGYSQSLAATQAIAFKGVIDPANPFNITWTAIADMPSGTNGRMGGGSALDERVYFTGGDPNGQGTTASVATIAYNTLTNLWELGPSKITAVSNISGFTMVIDNDSLYMTAVGGYNGAVVVSVNEWLNIGPYNPPAAQAGSDFAICDPGTASLSATGGLSYMWTVAGSSTLDDNTSATPEADLTVTDTFFVSIEQRFGCPVIDTQVVAVNLSSSSSQSPEICFGETYTVGATTYNAPGTYTTTLQTVNGCDSIVTTVLTILPQNTFGQSIDLCSGQTYTIGSSEYTISGIYNDTLTSIVSGCDSIVTTDLTIAPQLASNQNITVCFGETYTIGTSEYDESGIYNDTLVAAAGCDSIVTTNFTVSPQITSEQNVSVCFGETYQVGTSVYDEPGSYEDVLISSVGGCDSVVTTNLTIAADINTQVNFSGLTMTAVQTGATYQWYNCATELPVAGQTGASFTATANGSYAVEITVGNCTEFSACNSVTTVGIDENTANVLEIYPNPNNGTFFVKGAAEGEFKLVNELGQTVQVISLSGDNAFKVSVSGLNSGVYYLTGISGGKVTAQKIVITE